MIEGIVVGEVEGVAEGDDREREGGKTEGGLEKEEGRRKKEEGRRKKAGLRPMKE